MNSFTYIFQGFWPQVQNSYIVEHLQVHLWSKSLKCTWKSSLLTKLQTFTLQLQWKLNSFTDIFQGFQPQVQNSYFVVEHLWVAAYENLKKQKNTRIHLKNDNKGFRFLVKLQVRMPATFLKMKYIKPQFKLITLIFIIVIFINSCSAI